MTASDQRAAGSPPPGPPTVTPPERPSFRGLLLHQDTAIGYGFFIANDWQRLDLETTAPSAVMYAPAGDPLTSFSAEGRDLGLAVTADDLPALRTGFLRGLRQLPRSVIESSEADAIGRLLTMEARHTYREGDTTRKRWVRLLYQDSVQVRLVAQGATVEQFNYWLPMFYEAMRTFRFGSWTTELADPTGP